MAWVFFEVAGIMVAFIAINACPAGRFFEWAARLDGILYLIANSMDAGPAARAPWRRWRETKHSVADVTGLGRDDEPSFNAFQLSLFRFIW